MNWMIKTGLLILAGFLLFVSFKYEARIRVLESQVKAIQAAVL